MAINDGFHRYENILKKQLKLALRIYLSIAIVLSPIFLMNAANASAAEKWEILENVYDQPTNKVKIEARKITQEASNSGRYKVQVPVNASDLGSTVKRMLWAGAAISAVTALVNGVGWIIDTGSKTIKKPKDSSPDLPTFEYIWVNGYDSKYYQTSRDAAAAFLIVLQRNNSDLVSLGLVTLININLVKYDVVRKNGNSFSQYISVNRIKNPKYNPQQEPQYEIISDSQLGNEILGNGVEPNSNPTPTPEIITSAYSPNNSVSDAPAPQASNDALNNANPQPEKEPEGDTKPKPNEDTDGDGVPDTYNPEKPSEGESFQLPNFCEWAPSVCDFFTVQKADNKDIKNNQREQIEQDKTFFESVAEFFDWFKEEPEINQPQELDIEDLNIDADQVNLSGSSTCPQDSVSFSVMGKSVTLDMPYQPVCDALNFFKPAVLLVGAVASVYIVAGVRTKEEDQS